MRLAPLFLLGALTLGACASPPGSQHTASAPAATPAATTTD